jgi:histone-lysine N-methyltransferase SETD3
MQFRLFKNMVFCMFLLSICKVAKCDSFQDWFMKNGGYISPSLAVTNFDGMGKGFTVRKNIEIDAKILVIPSRLIFSSSSFIHIEIGTIKKTIVDRFSGETAIKVWLLIESKNKTSFYEPYIKSLPSYVPSLLYFDDEMLMELQNLKLRNKALKLQKDTLRDYEQFQHTVEKLWHLTSLSVVSWSDFQWATSILNSRGLRFQGNLYLAPMADLFNYAPHSEKRKSNSGSFFLKHHKLITNKLNTKESIDAVDSIAITSDRSCQVGQQLFEDYGDNSDDVYLLYHGFVAETNPFRCVDVDVGALTSFTEITTLRRQLLVDLEFKPSGPAPACVDRDGRVGFAIEVYLAVLVMTETEVESCAAVIKRNFKQWSSISAACGFDQVARHLQALRDDDSYVLSDSVSNVAGRTVELLQRLLSKTYDANRFSTTILEDEAILSELMTSSSVDDKGHSSQLHRRLAVQHRLQVKRLWTRLCSLYRMADCSSGKEGGLYDVNRIVASDAMNEQIVSTILTLPDKIELFNNWFHSHGPSPDYLRAAQIPPFRVGTITTGQVAQGQTYLGVPLSAIMDAEGAFADGAGQTVLTGATSAGPLIRRLVASYSRRDDFHELLFFLVFETFVVKSRSRFWPYLQLLPSVDELDTPLLWNEQQVRDRLDPSLSMETALQYQHSTRTKYESISNMQVVQEFFPGSSLSYERYRWATAILDSRSIWWAGKRHLVPMLDFINCREDPQFPHNIHSTALDSSGRYAITKSGESFSTTTV